MPLAETVLFNRAQPGQVSNTHTKILRITFELTGAFWANPNNGLNPCNGGAKQVNTLVLLSSDEPVTGPDSGCECSV